ncbi:MAG: hypothetical protein M1164_02180 [Candidatus Marsarchaeota archaeon]|jgi:uncharacterized HAD superfamily protein|nr:hypothetical protein [Candidatus Marsarchaeota archaeon]
MGEGKLRNVKGSIAVDLDNTLADTSGVVVGMIRERYNPKARIEGWNKYSAEKSFGIPRPTTLKLFHEAWKSWEKIPLVDGSIPSVLSRVHESSDIYIVTATVGRKEDFTRWLDSNGIPYDGIIVVEHFEEKITVGSMRGIRTYIDDYEIVARSVAAAGRQAILFERPWNSDFAESNQDPNIIPARSWEEIGSILDSTYAGASNQ